jgi:hypothetical protein
MQTSISNILSTVTRKILGLTLYDMMRSSHDFEDVKAALTDRTDWSIELVSTSGMCILHHVSPLRESLYSFVAASRRGTSVLSMSARLTIPRSIQLSNGGYFFMCALSFLVMAENIHIHYGRLSPAELKVSILSDMVIPSLT